MTSKTESFIKKENRKAHQRRKEEVQRQNAAKIQAMEEEKKILEQMAKKTIYDSNNNGQEITFELKEEYDENLVGKGRKKVSAGASEKKRGKGRPKKEDGPAPVIGIRLSGDFRKLFTSFTGKGNLEKAENLLGEYARLKNLVIRQMNIFRANLYQARKYFEEMHMSRTIYKYKLMGNLEITSEEKRLNEKFKNSLSQVKMLMKFGEYSGKFLKMELSQEEFEFLNWALTEIG